jgi:hypothetical protein
VIAVCDPALSTGEGVSRIKTDLLTGADLIPIPSPKEKGNQKDLSEAFGMVFALVFEFPSPLGQGVGGEVFLQSAISITGKKYTSIR